jgi:hypothetical protein
LFVASSKIRPLPLTQAERDDLQICFVNEIASDDEQLEDDTVAIAAQEIARPGFISQINQSICNRKLEIRRSSHYLS